MLGERGGKEELPELGKFDPEVQAVPLYPPDIVSVQYA